MGPDELRDYRALQVFQHLDKNGDGVLDASELRRARKLTQADTDGDGQVTQQEYLAFLALQAQQRTAQQQIVADFQAADANSDHRLDASEWPATASASFATVDANADGYVTWREVVTYVKGSNGLSPF